MRIDSASPKANLVEVSVARESTTADTIHDAVYELRVLEMRANMRAAHLDAVFGRGLREETH